MTEAEGKFWWAAFFFICFCHSLYLRHFAFAGLELVFIIAYALWCVVLIKDK
jgi:hypothetical protein